VKYLTAVAVGLCGVADGVLPLLDRAEVDRAIRQVRRPASRLRVHLLRLRARLPARLLLQGALPPAELSPRACRRVAGQGTSRRTPH